MEKAKEYTSEEQQWLTENRLSRFQNRITPSWIRDMGENEIFVFAVMSTVIMEVVLLDSP